MLNSYIIKKLKEGRTNAKLKQSEVAERLGIKGNTLSNYENGVSEPDIDTFCALCDIYNIDPSNILNEAYGLGIQGEEFKIKPSEVEHIKKYRALDLHGKEMVDFTLLKEWERSISETPSSQDQTILDEKYTRPDNITPIAKEPITLAAAHHRTDVDQTAEGKAFDDSLMDDDDEWK